MILPDLVLAVFLSLPSAVQEDSARLRPISDAIAAEAEEAPLFAGDQGAEKTALLLSALAVHESGLRESVRTCAVKGDGGLSLGLFQLHAAWAWGGFSPRAVCDDDRLQAHLALRVLHAHARRGVTSLPGLFRAYASGNAGQPSRAADELHAVYGGLVKRAQALR